MKRATEATVLVPLCLLLALLGLIACGSNGGAPMSPSDDAFAGGIAMGTPVPFQTVEQGSGGVVNYEQPEPRLVIMTSPGAINRFTGIRPEAVASLRRVDYNEFLAIVAFQG
jgi:hypothetical protein